MNDEHDGRFLFSFRINDKGFDRAGAGLHLYPFAMPGRVVQARLGPILRKYWSNQRKYGNDQKSSFHRKDFFTITTASTTNLPRAHAPSRQATPLGLR